MPLHTKAIPLVLALLISSPFISFTSFATNKFDQQQIAESIKRNLEDNLYQLPPRIQGHFGIRMYRMTGDEKYANSALVDLYAVSDAQSFYACQLDDEKFVFKASQNAIAKLGKGPRAKARKNALKPFPEFLFYTDILLRYGSRINEFGLKGPCDEKMIAALKQVDLTKGLTNKAMIEAWSAQLANYVYWAKQLGVGDYVDVYTKAFQQTYADDNDHLLSKKQFKNKIYGMTHFIFAASEYYQHKVDKQQFSWILNYFEKNIDRIINETTPDIIAEVGISFLLAGENNHPIIQITRTAVTKAYDTDDKIIPSPSGNTNLALGEHRNVLAIMLINWPTQLHKGPYLGELKATKRNLPKNVSVIH